MIKLPNGATPEWLTIDALIRSRAESHAGCLAFEMDGRQLSCADLDRLSDSLAANLRRLGVAKGDRVATMLFNSVEQTLSLLGTVKLGAIWTPFNVSLQAVDLKHVIDDSDPAVIIFDGETKEKLAALPDDVLAGRRVLVVGSEDADTSFEALLSAAPGPMPRELILPDDPALIIYTGGTTGLPKGVVLPHFAVIAAGYRYVECFGVTDDDVHYSVLSLFMWAGCCSDSSVRWSPASRHTSSAGSVQVGSGSAWRKRSVSRRPNRDDGDGAVQCA